MKNHLFTGVCAVALLALAAPSCSTGTRSPSGFLSNYSQLNSGYGSGDALSAFLKPGADLAKYDSVTIDPVTTVVAAPGISAEAKDQLAAYLSASLHSELSRSLKVVSAPGPSTLRVRTALTDVIEGQKLGKPTRTVHINPQATLTGTIGSDTVAAFVSNVSFEGEILDSTTGERLAALSDHRIGAKREATSATTWAAVRSATQQGAKRLHDRFVSAGGR
jgi:Protein of unknown function (DUF3313)